MKTTYLKILPVVLTLFIFCSCSGSTKKETAYCFSALFDYADGMSRITIYCKIPSSDNENVKESENEVMSFYGNNFYDAFSAINESDYEIYFDSLCAVYLSDNVKTVQVSEIASVIFGNTDYNASCSVYSQSYGRMPSVEVLHSYAVEICETESIPKTSRKNYKNAVEYFRLKLLEEGKNEEQA